MAFIMAGEAFRTTTVSSSFTTEPILTPAVDPLTMSRASINSNVSVGVA